MKMHAWQVDDFGHYHDAMQWRETDRPSPSGSDALVKVDAIGLNFYAGSPRCCPLERAREIAEYIDAGVNYFILAPIMPPENRRAHLERLAGEVIPGLAKMEPGRVA